MTGFCSSVSSCSVWCLDVSTALSFGTNVSEDYVFSLLSIKPSTTHHSVSELESVRGTRITVNVSNFNMILHEYTGELHWLLGGTQNYGIALSLSYWVKQGKIPIKYRLGNLEVRKLRSRWKKNIKMRLQLVRLESLDWIAQEKVQWRAVVNFKVKCWFTRNVRKLLTSRMILIFTRPSLQNNGKGKGHPGTGHEGPERE